MKFRGNRGTLQPDITQGLMKFIGALLQRLMKFRGNRGTLPVDRKQGLMKFRGNRKDTATRHNIRIEEVQRKHCFKDC